MTVRVIDCTTLIDVVMTSDASTTSVFIHQRQHLDPRAQLAQTFMGAMLNAPTGVELTDEALVKRAFDLADRMFEEARRRGLTVQVPSYESMMDQPKQEKPNGPLAS